MAKKGPEAQTQKAIMDWLAAKHILAFRMNSGAMFGEYKGKRWAVRFGTPGMADIQAFVKTGETLNVCPDWRTATAQIVYWIECKAPKGTQSEDQKSFEIMVKNYGHRYILAKSLDDVIVALK